MELFLLNVVIPYVLLRIWNSCMQQKTKINALKQCLEKKQQYQFLSCKGLPRRKAENFQRPRLLVSTLPSQWTPPIQKVNSWFKKEERKTKSIHAKVTLQKSYITFPLTYQWKEISHMVIPKYKEGYTKQSLARQEISFIAKGEEMDNETIKSLCHTSAPSKSLIFKTIL